MENDLFGGPTASVPSPVQAASRGIALWLEALDYDQEPAIVEGDLVGRDEVVGSPIFTRSANGFGGWTIPTQHGQLVGLRQLAPGIVADSLGHLHLVTYPDGQWKASLKTVDLPMFPRDHSWGEFEPKGKFDEFVFSADGRCYHLSALTSDPFKSVDVCEAEATKCGKAFADSLLGEARAVELDQAEAYFTRVMDRYLQRRQSRLDRLDDIADLGALLSQLKVLACGSCCYTLVARHHADALTEQTYQAEQYERFLSPLSEDGQLVLRGTRFYAIASDGTKHEIRQPDDQPGLDAVEVVVALVKPANRALKAHCAAESKKVRVAARKKNETVAPRTEPLHDRLEIEDPADFGALLVGGKFYVGYGDAGSGGAVSETGYHSLLCSGHENGSLQNAALAKHDSFIKSLARPAKTPSNALGSDGRKNEFRKEMRLALADFKAGDCESAWLRAVEAGQWRKSITEAWAGISSIPASAPDRGPRVAALVAAHSEALSRPDASTRLTQLFTTRRIATLVRGLMVQTPEARLHFHHEYSYRLLTPRVPSIIIGSHEDYDNRSVQTVDEFFSKPLQAPQSGGRADVTPPSTNAQKPSRGTRPIDGGQVLMDF